MSNRKTYYDKIAASLNNSAAIDKNGEVYVWGLAKTGILGDNITTNQYQPTCINIKGVNSQYKAVHVSMGLNHIAVIVNYAILDLIDFNNIPPSSIQKMLDDHSVEITKSGLDLLKHFQQQMKYQRFVEKTIMEDFFRQNKIFKMEEDQTYQASQIQEFYDFFCTKDPSLFNLVEYFYQTNKAKIKGQKLIVWGISDSGRLGLDFETLKGVQTNKIRRKGQKDVNNTSQSEIDEDEDGQLTKAQNLQSFVRSYVNKTENENIQHGIKHVACGHHHTLVISDEGSIYYFGMGTQGQLGNENFVNVSTPTKLHIKPKRKFIQVACGSSHSMALTDNGQIYSWGKNTRGQLGHSHRNDQLKPTMIIIEIMASSIACGDQHSAFISDEKELYTWGNGQYYRLGHGVTTDELYPKKVVVLEDVYVTHVSCGMTHTLAITNEGFVYAWGDGMSGKLGVQENNKSLHLPSRVGMNDIKFRKKVYYQVSAGGLHSLALTDQGILYAWGSTKGGVLGVGFQRDNKEYYSLPQKIRTVAKIQSKRQKQIQFFSIKKFNKEQKLIEQQKIKDIEQQNEDESNQAIQKQDESISLLDNGAIEQVDYDIPFIQEIYPLRLIFQNLKKVEDKTPNQKIIFVVAAANNSFFISDLGQIHACGSPKKGLFIMDPKNEKLIIRKKKLLLAKKDEDEQGKMLTGGGDNTSVTYSKSNMQRAPSMSQRQQSSLKSNTLVSVQNKNLKKKQQQPEQNYTLVFDFPFLIPYFKNKIIYMSCSYTHAIAISHKGVAYSWGSNKYYQLGLGYMCKYNHVPQKIQGALETKRIVMSACSDKFSALLTDKGEIWTFGTSDSGVLGHEDKNYYVVSEPKMINDIPPMIYLASGPQGMMSISEQKRQIYAWGNNLYGQLGIQITNNNMNMNQFGQDFEDSEDEMRQKEKNIDLDDQNKKITKNQIIYKPVKVKIENDRKIQIRSVAMGMFHSVAIDDLGHLYSCGLRKFSGLAESLSKEGLSGFDDTFIYLKKEILLNHQFQQVSVSEYHTLALTQDQTGDQNNIIFGWGLCNLGNLCLKDQREIQQAMKDMRYQMKDIDLNDPLKDMFSLPVNLTQLNKFNDCENIVYISAGLMHNLAMNSNGKVFSWGSFQNGKLGIQTANLNLPPDQFFTTEPKIVSVLFNESKEEGEGEFLGNNNQEVSQKRSTQSRMKSQSIQYSLSKQKTLTKAGQSTIQQQQEQQQQQPEEEEENDEDLMEIDDAEIDILEQSSFGSDSSKDVFSSDSNLKDEQMDADNSMQSDMYNNSIDQDLTQFQNQNGEDDTNLTIEQMNLYSKLPQNHKKQDEVQKKIWKEEDHCLEENLIKEDKDLEDLAKQIIFKCLKLVYENEKSIQQAESKIESIIQTQIKKEANSKLLQFIEKLYLNIPSFVVKNIQLYETIFSLLYYHPCYILNLLKTNTMTIFHLKSLIDVLFKNPIDVGPSNFTLITLTIETFKHEYKLGSIHINDIKNIQQSSLFWHLYTLLFERQKTTVDYFKKLVNTTIGQDICVQIYLQAPGKQSKENRDNTKQLNNILDYLQGTQEQIELKSKLLLKTIQPLMSQIASDFQNYSNANQQVFTEELIFVHNKIVNFAKKYSLKKHAQMIRKEKFLESAKENQNEEENNFFIDRQIQKKLQYMELSLDNKLNNFIFLISYGFLIYMIENLESFNIQIESEYLPILKSPNNVKVIAELLERFITKSSIKINNRCFDDINQFLLERKENKHNSRKKSNDFTDIKKLNSTKQKLGNNSDSDQSSIDENIEKNAVDNGNTFTETQADSSQDDELNLDAIIDKLQKSLYYESDFELSVSQIQSQVESSSNLKTHFLQVSLSLLFQIHNIYSQNHSNSDLFVITKDKVEKAKIDEDFKKFDPIYIIFSYLQFESINIEDFQTEILERKVNLKLSNDLNYYSYQILKITDFYKCLDCQAILPIHYLPSNQQLIIKKIKSDQREQWKCSKGHLNSLKNYKCIELTCDEFIEENAIKNFRIIKYYNVSKEYDTKFYKNKSIKKQNDLAEPDNMVDDGELTKKEILTLIYKILKNCDPLKEGENEYVFFDKFSKKPRLKENSDLKNSVLLLLEELKRGYVSIEIHDQGDEQDQNDPNLEKIRSQDLNSQGGSEDGEEDEEKIREQTYWNEKFKYYKEMLGKIIDKRRVHSQKQRLVKKALSHADALLLENIAKLQDIVGKKQKTLAILINSLIPESVKQTLKEQQQMQKLQEREELVSQDKSQKKLLKYQNSDFKKPDQFAYYTTQKLFKKKALISISFSSSNQQIVEIEKSIKFYIFCNNEGSFEILIVYSKEAFLDNFTAFISELYPNRLLLHKIYISVAQYREMKRLQYSNTNITFSTDTIKITFDMNKLVHILQKKEGKIFQMA